MIALGLSLPAGDLMPSVSSSDASTSSTGRRHHSVSTNSRAFFNSHYPRPPRHRPLHAPSHEPPSFSLPPSPPVFQMQSDAIKMSEEFSPSFVPRNGFPEFTEMSRSLNDYGNSSSIFHHTAAHHPQQQPHAAHHHHHQAAPTSASSAAAIATRGRSKLHSDRRSDSDDALCAQIDGLDISAKSASPTVLSVLTEFSLNKRHSKPGAHSIMAALSAPSTLQRSECNSSASAAAHAHQQPRPDSISDAASMAAVPEHGIFAFDDEADDAPMPEGMADEPQQQQPQPQPQPPPHCARRHQSAHHVPPMAEGAGLASMHGANPWRGVM